MGWSARGARKEPAGTVPAGRSEPGGTVPAGSSTRRQFLCVMPIKESGFSLQVWITQQLEPSQTNSINIAEYGSISKSACFSNEIIFSPSNV